MLTALSGPLPRQPYSPRDPAAAEAPMARRAAIFDGLSPDAEFIAPDAPFPNDAAPRVFEWFKVQDRSPASVLAGVRVTAQRTMAALHVGIRRAQPFAGIVGYSGRLPRAPSR